jgi:hypothetical protein
MLQVTLGVSFLGGWAFLFSLEWWDLYMVWGVWLPSHLPLEGVDHIRIHGLQMAPCGTGVFYPDTHGTRNVNGNLSDHRRSISLQLNR